MSVIAAISPQTEPAKPAADKEVLPVQKPSEKDSIIKDLSSLTVQSKLTVGAPDDPYEQEADAMADKVMRMPEQSFVQRQCDTCENDGKLQRKPQEDEEEEVQLKRDSTANFIQRKCAGC